jgi:hypothetical protein
MEWQRRLGARQADFEAAAGSPSVLPEHPGVAADRISERGWAMSGARVVSNAPLSIETASRLTVMADMLGLPGIPDAIERAVAAQWFIDEQVIRGRHLEVVGPGKERYRVIIPASIETAEAPGSSGADGTVGPGTGPEPGGPGGVTR